ncbi:MAG: polyprenyl diphosphate synthase [Patescibacteria group bacterium]
MPNPNHIAVIPDGNRRWARKKGMRVVLGHKKGAETFETILKVAFDEKIPYLTIWGSSVGNVTKRSPAEVRFLFGVFKNYFAKLRKDKRLHTEEVRVRILGKWRKYFPAALRDEMERLIAETKQHKRYNLTFLMAYSGVEDMEQAVKSLASGKKKVSAASIKESLWTAELPAVDLVIRTGGEPHWSQGFMMWDVAESQLVFTETLWPDFSEKEFLHILARYRDTERRLGA